MPTKSGVRSHGVEVCLHGNIESLSPSVISLLAHHYGLEFSYDFVPTSHECHAANSVHNFALLR